MLHLGHFSFDERDPADPSRHGYFTLIVEAEEGDAAAQMFKEHIHALKKTWKLFEHVASVYIEDIFAVEETPRKPLLLRFQSSAGPFPDTESRSLPVVEPAGIRVFGWTPEVEGGKEKAGSGYRESEPFIKFDVQP
ncbi:MAG: hypothetical protein C4530_02930 [Desulfobacteraceae bacterium]|nr:MAG: hypothetical protein C4530_02930 [Desulfobacteraceae bacterium]